MEISAWRQLKKITIIILKVYKYFVAVTRNLRCRQLVSKETVVVEETSPVT